MFTAIKNALLWASSEAYDLVVGLVDVLIMAALSALPADWQASVTGYAGKLAFAENWVPVKFGLGLAVSWLGFQLAWIPVRWTVRLLRG